MNEIDFDKIQNWYKDHFEDRLLGRRIVLEDIQPIVKELNTPFDVTLAGQSELGKDIHQIKFGNGSKRIMIWTQMHGNESTGTKALFDLFKYIKQSLKDSDNLFIADLIQNCTILCLPILNPDGSDVFTRVNSNKVDLNRDAVDLSAKESKLLRNILDEFNPHFCFNLHDQRTIFNVEGFKNPATISFLAPSIDIERTLTEGRKETMSVIVAMNKVLQKIIPNHIGRYTDEFYPTATGDNFQKLGHNTILIEAGHYYEDYHREKVRMYNFFALLEGLHFLTYNNKYTDYQPYFNIPNNGKQNYDLIIRNFKDESNNLTDVGFLYDYEVVNGKLVFKLVESGRGDLSDFNGYKEL